MIEKRTSPWRQSLVLFFVAVVAGAAFLLAFPPKRFFLDEHEYFRLAQTLLEQGTFGIDGTRAFRTPGYPAFVAAILAAFVGGGGLGNLIIAGNNISRSQVLVLGAALPVLMALSADAFFEMLEHRTRV